jgi:predicted lipoprotein
MNSHIRKLTGVAVILFLSLFSCSKSSGPGTENPRVEGFDKTAMLTSYADNIIIPAYQQLQQQINSLQTATNAFLDAPSVATQNTVKTAYRQAHLQYERVEVFNFGPAGAALLDVYTNFSGGLDYSFSQAGELAGYSIDSVTIENNIASGTYNLETYSRNNFYAQGFPALNYLLFSPNAIEKFGTNTTARVKYVKDVLTRMKGLADKVSSDWGTYRNDFISNTKTDVGSPIGNMVNQLAYQLDLLKGPRIGWPFGKQSNGIVFATKTEAYFAGISSELARENIRNLKKVFSGAGSGHGISDYLEALNNKALSTDVLAQFDILIAKLDAIPDPLSETLTGQPAVVEAAYKEIQKLVTLLKTDVASATGVQITFMDNDGD